jgi:hypothetical protein
VPQLNVMSLGFPLRIIVGLGVIVASLAAIDEAIVDGTTGTLEALLASTGAEPVDSAVALDTTSGPAPTARFGRNHG